MSKRARVGEMLVGDYDYLLIDLNATDVNTKLGVESLTKEAYLLDLKALRERGEGDEAELIEADFESELLSRPFNPELTLTYRISDGHPLPELRGKELEVKLRLLDIKMLHERLLLSNSERDKAFEKGLRLEVEVERLKGERERAERDFTSKIKEIEANLSVKVQDGLRRREEELVTRFKEELNDLKLYGLQPLLTSFLPSFLTLKSVIASGERNEDKGVQAYLRGFDMIVRSMSDSLASYGVIEVLPQVGDSFDANLHSGDSTARDTSLPEGVILEVRSSGYKLHDRLIIPAVVVVNKH